MMMSSGLQKPWTMYACQWQSHQHSLFIIAAVTRPGGDFQHGYLQYIETRCHVPDMMKCRKQYNEWEYAIGKVNCLTPGWPYLLSHVNWVTWWWTHTTLCRRLDQCLDGGGDRLRSPLLFHCAPQMSNRGSSGTDMERSLRLIWGSCLMHSDRLHSRWWELGGNWTSQSLLGDGRFCRDDYW